MQNPKYIALFAGIGFVLSLLIGLFSSVKVSTLLFRAFLSALFSGALTWGLGFVFYKLFDNISELEGLGGDEIGKSVIGSHVNVSLGDDSLEDAEDAPHFFVNQNAEAKPVETERTSEIQKSNEVEQIESSQKAPPLFQNTSSTKEGGDKPSTKAGTFEVTQEGFQAKSLVETQNIPQKEKEVFIDENDVGSLIDELDDLPTISVINREMGVEPEETKSIGSGTMQVHHIDGDPEQDASLIAQAIKTVLTKDS